MVRLLDGDLCEMEVGGASDKDSNGLTNKSHLNQRLPQKCLI